MIKKLGIGLGALAITTALFAVANSVLANKTPASDIRLTSVKIVNRALNHGGTGIILQSTSTKSTVLTNDHVCKVIKDGGIVRTAGGADYQVTAIVESRVSDLCLASVDADLKYNTEIAPFPPSKYDMSQVSGHPGLMPNIVSTGHFSGRETIQVLTGFRACTKEEEESPETSLACAFFGGLPVLKSYESVLVSSTIMPGSSGSGVYNADGKLSGVVFAGQGGFGYAWTVPYEQVINFLYAEAFIAPVTTINQEVDLFGTKRASTLTLQQALQKCMSPRKAPIIVKFCEIIKRDMTYLGN